jgi:hypothetical protein
VRDVEFLPAWYSRTRRRRQRLLLLGAASLGLAMVTLVLSVLN